MHVPRTDRGLGWDGGPLRAIVVAHLDGVSAGPAANDNGSGIGALLEVARLLGDRSGVLYAALGAEERVMTGSKLHLGSARLLRSLGPADRRSVRLVLSLDMVGYGPALNIAGSRAGRTARPGSRSQRPTGSACLSRTSRTAASPTTRSSPAGGSRLRGSSGAGTRAGTRPATGRAASARRSSRRRSTWQLLQSVRPSAESRECGRRPRPAPAPRRRHPSAARPRWACCPRPTARAGVSRPRAG